LDGARCTSNFDMMTLNTRGMPAQDAHVDNGNEIPERTMGAPHGLNAPV